MSDAYYPVLDSETILALGTVKMLSVEDPAYLDGSPYSPEVKSLIEQLVERETPAENIAHGGDDDLVDEINALFDEMKAYGESVSAEGVDPKDKAAYFRVAVSLTEKVLTYRERASKIKEWKMFIAKVLSFLEEIDPDLRTRFMDRIEEFAQ